MACAQQLSQLVGVTSDFRAGPSADQKADADKQACQEQHYWQTRLGSEGLVHGPGFPFTVRPDLCSCRGPYLLGHRAVKPHCGAQVAEKQAREKTRKEQERLADEAEERRARMVRCTRFE